MTDEWLIPDSARGLKRVATRLHKAYGPLYLFAIVLRDDLGSPAPWDVVVSAGRLTAGNTTDTQHVIDEIARAEGFSEDIARVVLLPPISKLVIDVARKYSKRQGLSTLTREELQRLGLSFDAAMGVIISARIPQKIVSVRGSSGER